MDDIGEDRNARRKVRKIFLPYNVEDDGVHTDIAQWRLRKLKTDSDEVDFSQMTKAQLEAYGRKLGIELDKRQTKTDLIAKLEEFISTQEES